jgi:chromosomal replication initiator protein
MSSPADLIAIEKRVERLETLVAGGTTAQRLLAAEPPVAAIVADISFHTGIPSHEIVSERRYRAVFRARAAAIWVALRVTDYSLARLGRCLGGRDHGSMLNARDRAGELRARDPAFRRLTDRALAEAKARHPLILEDVR